MSRHVGWLLTEIERQSEGRLSNETRTELIAEVSAHLDAAIQARLELGMEIEDAEREAVQEFGHPREYVMELLKLHEPKPDPKQIWKGDRVVMTVFWTGSLICLAWMDAGIKQTTPLMGFTAAGIILSAFAIASFRSRCFRVIPLAKASFSVFVLCALMLTLTWHNLWNHGGRGVMPDWQTTEFSQKGKMAVEALDADMKLIRKGTALHQKELTDAQIAKLSAEDRQIAMSEVRFDPGYLKVLAYGLVDPNDIGHLVLVPANHFLHAQASWRDAAFHLNRLEGAADDERNCLAAIENARNGSPFADLRSNIEGTIPVFPALFVLTAFLNLIFGSLGAVASRYRIVRSQRA